MKKINKLSLLVSLSIILACSNDVKNDNTNSISKRPSGTNNQRNLNVNSNEGKDYDACDCNRRSQKILNKTIALRLKFDSINDLKADQGSKSEMKIFAKEYVTLVKKCFEINNARLLVDSECNNLKVLQAKKDSLRMLGIQLEQGEAIRL
ncbi:MAG: hypothetical protein ACJZ12_04630 [Candidatus Neomarinimicrobiota bacterium]